MTGTATFATSSGFMGLTRAAADVEIHIAGIPLDIGTTNRSVAASAPPPSAAATIVWEYPALITKD